MRANHPTGAIHQYHSSLILLSETYASNVRYHEDRVWKCLDFVFETNPSLPRKEKARLILTDIVQKTEVYGALRRVRAPQEVEKAIAAEEADIERRRQSQQQIPSPSANYMQAPTEQYEHERQRMYPQTQTQTMNEQSPAVPVTVQEAPQIVVDSNASPATTSSDNTADVIRGREDSFGSGGSPSDPMVDVNVDWNEWDKMFPPEAQFSEFGSLPDFNFSTMIPENTLHFPNV